MIRRFFKWTGRAVGAGLLALALLNLFCVFYYNVPVHYTNPDGATEYKWEAGRFYSKGTEGFALGRTNNDGFNNLRDHTPGEAVDILLMGSSHMEGFNVAQDENAAALLNERYGGERYVYNIGTAGHTLLYCVKHLDRALAVYAPAGWVVLETMSLDFAPGDMDAVVDGTYPDIPSHTGGLLTMLQKLPFLRLFYTQYIKKDGKWVEATGDDIIGELSYTEDLTGDIETQSSTLEYIIDEASVKKLYDAWTPKTAKKVIPIERAYKYEPQVAGYQDIYVVFTTEITFKPMPTWSATIDWTGKKIAKYWYVSNTNQIGTAEVHTNVPAVEDALRADADSLTNLFSNEFLNNDVITNAMVTVTVSVIVIY